MEGKIGSIVAIEPSTGEVLCMVSSPSYDPRMMVGRQRSKSHHLLSQNVWKPLLNRSIMGQYPPGSTFKTTQGLTFMTEGIIHPTQTAYPCGHGFNYKGLHVGCHGHASPLPLVPALSTSCNGYFCWGLFYMLSAKSKYGSVQKAMNTWRDYMVSMGFGYRLGVDLPGEKRGLIPNAQFYDNAYKGSWNGLTIISIAIGQGEVNATPLQIANLGATIANRGWYYVPHIHKNTTNQRYLTKRQTKVAKEAYAPVVEGMRLAVENGTATNIKTTYPICGKTGTIENPGKDHSAFIAFAPMNNPKIAIAVYVEHGGFGTDLAAPMAGLVIEAYLKGKLSPASEQKAKRLEKKQL
jgi:penicillin-binding protein 2